MKHKGILAIDFDSTIAETNFPEIIKPIKLVKFVIDQLRKEGWFIIVNTCRSGNHVNAAVNFLYNNQIGFDLINENHPDLCELFEYDCRKISADIYIDDKNLDTLITGVNWLDIYAKIKKVEANGFTSMLILCQEK